MRRFLVASGLLVACLRPGTPAAAQQPRLRRVGRHREVRARRLAHNIDARRVHRHSGARVRARAANEGGPLQRTARRVQLGDGRNVKVASVALATFRNEMGLKQVGGATLTETDSSGAPEFSKAMEYVFGTVILTSSIEVSKRITFSRDIACRTMTVEGDSMDPAGGVSGGYHRQRAAAAPGGDRGLPPRAGAGLLGAQEFADFQQHQLVVVRLVRVAAGAERQVVVVAHYDVPVIHDIDVLDSEKRESQHTTIQWFTRFARRILNFHEVDVGNLAHGLIDICVIHLNFDDAACIAAASSSGTRLLSDLSNSIRSIP